MRRWTVPSTLISAVFLVAEFAGWTVPPALAANGGGTSCKNFGVTNLVFGAYDPLSSAPLDSMGSVTYNCPPPLSPQVAISQGGAGSFAPRAMTNPADPMPLQYNLYVDAARTTVWGDGSGQTSAPAVPSGNGASIPIYGRVFPQQDVAAGTFSDTVVVTFNF